MDIQATRALLRSHLTGAVGGHSAQRQKAYARLFECPLFLREMFRPGRFTDGKLKEQCAAWIKVDKLLDLRLARLAPGRTEDRAGLASPQLARLLQVLHHISSGPRLILLVNHLKQHPNAEVAESATVLVGRRIRNVAWVKQRLASTEPRIRAVAVESLWAAIRRRPGS
ncbi:MAG TPA: hypothetical protein VG456_03365 [Candidatus Sulfopaludibacter sp.]|jgi:hypothetical protein|nr:hypothetical protein [Candidatus Sulfopaludibacter sp.]